MKTLHFYTIAASLALGLVVTSHNVQASQDARYFHDHTRNHELTVQQLRTIDSHNEQVLFSTIKKELLNAKTESEIDQAIAAITLYRFNYPQSLQFQLLLNEVNENITYYRTRINDRFDYSEVKKGLGLGIITGVAVYGIKAVQKKCYEPHEARKEQIHGELQAEGIVVPGNHYFGYELEGFNPNDLTVHNKIQDYRTHQLKADASRLGQGAIGVVGLGTGLSGLAHLYKGLTTDCAKEYARYSLLKLKLEEANAAYNAAKSNQR